MNSARRPECKFAVRDNDVIAGRDAIDVHSEREVSFQGLAAGRSKKLRLMEKEGHAVVRPGRRVTTFQCQLDVQGCPVGNSRSSLAPLI